MEISEISKEIIIKNEKILKSQISSKQSLFTNFKGLTFVIHIEDKFCNIGKNGCCYQFENNEEVYKLFDELEIFEYRKKLDKILLNKSKFIEKIFLVFLMKYNWREQEQL